MIGVPEITCEDLWIFAFDKKKVFYKDFSRFCNNQPEYRKPAKLSKQTMTKYIKDLEKEKKLERDLDQEDRYPHYFVPKEKHDEVRALKKQRLFTKEFGNLNERERALVLEERTEKERKQLLSVLALDGPVFIPEIAAKTELTETKILEMLWGPLLNLDLFSCDKNYHLPTKERKYGLGLCGLYRALRENMDYFEVIVEKWGYLHPFIFTRIPQLGNYGLVETLKDFIVKVRPRPNHLGDDKTQKEIEDYLIAFIVLGFNHRFLRAWLRFFHGDKQFRERVESRLKESIEQYQSNIKFFQNMLKIMGTLGRRSEPDWEKMKWNIGQIHALEMFLHFPWFFPEEPTK